MNNLGQSVTNLLWLARKIQAISADGKNNAKVYELATQAVLEAQHIREFSERHNAYAERTVADIIKNTGQKYG